MAPDPNGASGSGTKHEAAAKTPAKDPKKKDEKKDEDLSEEDLALKQQLELYVERVQDPDPGLQKIALESMRQEIRTSTSSMTSAPKPLKFLRPHYGTLKNYYETMADSELKKLLADILSVLALTMSAEGERESLMYRLVGSEGDIGSWGHEYVRNLSGEISQEYAKRQGFELLGLCESMSEAMYANDGEIYNPPPEFAEDAKESLVDIKLTDSTELWLIQCSNNQQPDFHGKELSLELHRDGVLDSFKDSSGKSYDVVSFQSQEPVATVFLPSTLEPKVVGKISRRVSLLHFPDPKEYEKLASNSLRERHHHSTVTALKNSSQRFASPTPSGKISMGGHKASAHSSRSKSTLFEAIDSSKFLKKRHSQGTPVTGSKDQSTLDSGRGHSASAVSGSSEHSYQWQSKKKRKSEKMKLN
ncbi:hypothetical protein CFOL_v3_17548 [Cephalotus follicularis]|uniref:RPN1 N-terminal domain-containing protein n=1 Tax=Cephalotus follicularis TaxID=3775 RepID=A0A1Q3C1K1_CEPFO|nr:hypothetical protein CFOL_v3_17548 [Cephalotus follicularis]